jgi:hypothetical protein
MAVVIQPRVTILSLVSFTIVGIRRFEFVKALI